MSRPCTLLDGTANKNPVYTDLPRTYSTEIHRNRSDFSENATRQICFTTSTSCSREKCAYALESLP